MKSVLVTKTTKYTVMVLKLFTTTDAKSADAFPVKFPTATRKKTVKQLVNGQTGAISGHALDRADLMEYSGVSEKPRITATSAASDPIKNQGAVSRTRVHSVSMRLGIKREAKVMKILAND